MSDVALAADLAAVLREATNAPPERPRALPYLAFRDERLLELELTTLFRRDWILACREQEVPNPGDYRAITVGGEPVVVVRGRDGALRALANTCRHRGTLIVDGYGSANRLECPYHAWTYTLAGGLISTPYHGNVTIDKVANCLPSYRLECWGGLVFVSLDETVEPLATRLAGLEELTERYVPSRYTLLPGQRGDFEIAANWKLVFENAMESYHLFKVHPKTLNDVVPTKGFTGASASSHRWAASEGEKVLWTEATGYDPDTVGEHERTHRLVVMIPPSMVALYDHLFHLYLAVDPVETDKTMVRVATFVPEQLVDDDWSDLTGRVDAFTREDIEIMSRAQRGTASRSNHVGQLVEMERIVGHFHNYLDRRLFGAGGEVSQIPG